MNNATMQEQVPQESNILMLVLLKWIFSVRFTKLPLNCDFIYIIYTNVIELESPMIHDKFQDHRTPGSEEKIEGFYHLRAYCDHLVHVTQNNFINFCFPFSRRLNIKFGFDWPTGFKDKDA